MPSIATVAEAVAGMDAEGLDGEAYDGGDVGVPPELRLALGHDSCSRPECSAIEASGPAHGPWREGVQIVKFKRCSRCKVYRYCSGECQRKDWSRHKRVCYAAAPNVTPKATPKPPAEATAAPDATAGGPAGGGAAEGHPPQGQGGEARAVERETCGPGWKLTSFQREGAFSQSEELD